MQTTEEISEKHKGTAGFIIHSMRVKYNSATAKIKKPDMLERMATRGYILHERELRNLISFIRRNDLASPGFIVSDTHGYWYTENMEEMQKVWETEYGRAISILKNISPLRKRFKHLLSEEQGNIFKAIENENPEL